MAPENGRQGAALSDQLFREPYRFNFYQAVRLLERLAHECALVMATGRRYSVGQDHPPEQEVVRFRAMPSLSFPASAVHDIRELPKRKGSRFLPDPPPEMTVTFMGLIGPSGVLPHHYTKLLIDRIRDKDHALQDFLDVFHHRAISLFFRAWEKYRFPVTFEKSQLDPAGEGEDLFTECLFSLVGLGASSLRNRFDLDDTFFLYYSGHFAHFPRSAAALESLLEDYFELPVRVEQLQGQWLTLMQEDHAVLPGEAAPEGANNLLGVDMVIGEKVWNIQSKIRLRLGPLNSRQFHQMLPNSIDLRPLGQVTRCYVGPDLEFDVQLVLIRDEVPEFQLNSTERTESPRLGWNTWVRTFPFAEDVADAVFSVEGT